MASLNWEQLTYKNVAIGIVLFAIANWAMSQFVIFPRMSLYQRESIRASLNHGVSSYLLTLGLIAFALFFVFYYRGRFGTHRNRIVVFAMATGAACGLVLSTILRVTWHF